MFSHVAFKVTSLSARIIALRTTERLFPGMGQHVCLEVSSMGARIITLRAVESPFTTPRQHIRIQIISHVDWMIHFLFQTLLELFIHFDFLHLIFHFCGMLPMVSAAVLCDN